MADADESDVIGRLPRLEDLSLRQVLLLDRKVLADVIQEELDDLDSSAAKAAKVARFQSVSIPTRQ
jgi:hypothetical protein